MSTPAGPARRRGIRPGDLLPLAIGAAALVLGTALGWDARLVEAIVTPPPLVRAALVAVALLLALAAFRRGIIRISEGRGSGGGDPAAGLGASGAPAAGGPAGNVAAGDPAAGAPVADDPAAGDPAAGDPGSAGPAALIRGVRLVFLGLAGLAAAGGWLLGHPLPLIVALVIAAVDVLETTFLLVVLGTRRLGGRDGRPAPRD